MARKDGVSTKKRIPSTAAATEDADDVLAQQFARDLKLLLRQVGDAKPPALAGKAKATEPASDAAAESDLGEEVAYYGQLAQKLVVLVNKLLREEQIALTKKQRLLLDFGDRFYAQREFRAASRSFYDTIISSYEAAEAVTGGESSLQQRSDSPKRGEEVYIRALYGKAMCLFQVRKRRDALVRHPGTLEKMLAALRLLQRGMQIATALSHDHQHRHEPHKSSWLVLNGSILIFSIARPLCTLGFAKDVVKFLKYAILAIESVVALSTTKYILWRLQLFVLTYECYEAMACSSRIASAATTATPVEDAYLKAGLKCAEYAQQAVLRLKKEEELDLPLPKHVLLILAQAQTTASMLVARAKAAASHETLSKRQIETTFASSGVAEHVRVATDMVESLSRADRSCLGMLTAPSTPQIAEQISELLEYLLEMVTPLLPPSPESKAQAEQSPPAVQGAELTKVFPMVFHMMLLRHLYRVGKTEQLLFLAKAGKARLALSGLETLGGSDRERCTQELGLFEALARIKMLTAEATAAALNDEEKSEMKTPVHLPPLQLLTCAVTLPPATALLALAKTLTGCLNQGSGTMGQTNRDLVLAVALLLWQQFALPILNELDPMNPNELPRQLTRVASELLLAVHLAFTLADLDDLLLHGQVGIRLTPLLQKQKNKRRLAIQVLRAILERIGRKRDELAGFDLHFEATTAGFAENAVALSCSTMSFAADHQLGRSDANTTTPTTAAPGARDHVGVYGTGSQFGSFLHDLCCLQVDMTLLLYQVELEEASAVDALPTSSAAVAASPSPFEPSSLAKSLEDKLLLECRKNGYSKVLLSIQHMRHHHHHQGDNSSSIAAENTAIAEQAIVALERLEAQETDLQARLKKLRAATIASPPSSDPHTHSKHSLEANGVPLAPVVIARSSSAMTVRIIEYLPSHPSLRKRKVAYYMVFAKPSGAGTAVSLNNNELPGTSEPVHAPQLQITISGLLPNESYVFAVAAFDSNDEVIQGIGQTADPVVALHPLPIAMCYGYLAQACYELNLIRPSASRAATALYSRVVSRDASSRELWKASAFHRHALRRDVIAKLPTPILNLAIQAILILTHDESGDRERDGLLDDAEHRSLLSRQVDALEASRKIAIGVELASAAANAEAIRVLSFKGYRALLPLLHLDQCNGLTFAPLVTFYEALRTIPRLQWDVDTKSIFARVSFELVRIGVASKHFETVVYPSLVSETLLLHHREAQHSREHSSKDEQPSNEYRSLCEVVATQQVLSSAGLGLASASQSAPVVPVSPAKHPAAPPKGAPAPAAANASGGSPQSTPRQPAAEDEPKLPLLQDTLQQANFSLQDALKALETQSAAMGCPDAKYTEYICKIACMALQKGDDATAETCLASAKLRGNMSENFRAVVAAVGGEHLLPEIVAGDDEIAPGAPPPPTGSAPTTARSVKTPRQSSQKPGAKDEQAAPGNSNLIIDTPSSSRASAFLDKGGDDDFLYLWAGEVFFLQALLLYRKLVALRSTGKTAVDAKQGPDFDSTFEMLHAGSHAIKQGIDEPESTEPLAGTDSAEPDTLAPTDAATPPKDELTEVFAQFLEKMSAACELFRNGKAWQALQASCQYVWNAIWIAWVSPDRISASSLASPSSRLLSDCLCLCVDALLEMTEAVVLAVKEQKALAQASRSASASQSVLAMNRSLMLSSMASTAVVTSAMNTMSADVTWIVNFISYAVKSLSAQQQWETIVRVGKKFHLLLGNDERGSRFSQRNFPVMIYSQRQLLESASAALAAAERDLATFTREFAESEAKKKKKKSRLVVEEVLTSEELEFRAKRAAMEESIHQLVETRDRERNEMLQLSAIHESLTKSTNKCVQALDAVHELVQAYRRGKLDAENSKEHQLALRNQIVSAYNHCILLSRQKRQQRLLCQAYEELGDFHLSCSAEPLAAAAPAAAAGGGGGGGRGNPKLAVKSWYECLDNAFGALNVFQNWREVLARSSKVQLPNGVSGTEQIQGDGLWTTLVSCSTLAKLVMHATSSSCFQAVEYSLMAAKIFRRLFASSLPHPTRAFLYGSYELGNELWPGRDLVDSERVSPFSLALFFILVPEVLLRYENSQHAVAAMPVVAGYEFFARYCLESKTHVANARRLRIEALVQCGRISEAVDTLSQLFDGVDAASVREQIEPNALVASVAYHDSKPLRDDANAAALAWFTALDAHKLHGDLLARAVYPEPLVLEVLLVVLRLLVHLSTHESNLVDGCSPLRPVAEKMAQALLQLLNQSKPSVESSDTALPQTWEDVHSAAIRGEVLLQQSYLAYSDGHWSIARELSVKALEACTGAALFPGAACPLDLEHELKFSLFRRASTFAAKCRLQGVLCDLAQGHFHAVLTQADAALHECRESGEEHLAEQVQVLRCHALIFLGKRDAAELDLEKLRATATSRFTNCSLAFVRSLLMASTVLRAKVQLTATHKLLATARDHLREAERVLDKLLERSGWIGVDSSPVDLESEKRLNVYNPAIASFILVKAALAQTLVECAADPLGSETPAQRQERVLELIEKGLRATLHTTKRVGSSKALLLLLKGSVLKKILINHQHSQSPFQQQHSKQASATHNHALQDQTQSVLLSDERIAHMFAEAAAALTESVETSIRSGGYDRRLVRTALLELVDLHGQKLVPDKEDEHVQAAFHYLSVAVQVQSHEFVLFETVELQAGTTTSLDKLPLFILSALGDSSAAAPPSASLDKKPEPPVPATAKKAGSAATGTSGVGVGDPGHSPPPDTARLINYYLRLQREQRVLPVCSDIHQETAHWLHTFLSQNHSSYSKACCLSELPSVPTNDPEIKASLVCAQWGRDITPAIRTMASSAGGAGDASTHTTTAAAASRLTLYFTLGTTRIDILCSDELVAAATSRMEDFLRAPLLSKRPGLDEKQVSAIRAQLSQLRTRMEDDESLVIDRSAFESELLEILRSVQVLFRPTRSASGTDLNNNSSQAKHGSAEQQHAPSALLDVFGNPILLPCTLEMVRNLENLFIAQRGVHVSDNALCYFLRDLLEQDTPSGSH